MLGSVAIYIYITYFCRVGPNDFYFLDVGDLVPSCSLAIMFDLGAYVVATFGIWSLFSRFYKMSAAEKFESYDWIMSS